MPLDIILILATLTVAIIGTVWKDPSRRVKIILICLAVIASLMSVLKAIGDSSDKKFLETAMTSSIIPTNGSYQLLERDVKLQGATLGLDRVNCFHEIDGTTCFLWSEADPNKHGTVVFIRYEVAQMYANTLKHEKNGKIIKDVFGQSFDPKTLDEDFTDRVGLLGSAVYFDLFATWPDYNYGDFGVSVVFDRDGKQQDVTLSREELVSFKESKAPNLFYAVEQKFREKFKAQFPEAEKTK